jgi:hypothetical protein
MAQANLGTKRGAVRHALAALVLGVAAGGAHAAAYVGNWDPVYNPSNPLWGTSGTAIANLGWRGGFALTADDSCIPAPTAGLVTVSPAGTCFATMTAAFAEFYVTTDPLQSTIGRVDFLASSFNSGSLNSITALQFSGDQLVNIATQLSAPAAASAPASSALSSPALTWRLQFIIPVDAGGYAGPSLDYRLLDDRCIGVVGNVNPCFGSNSISNVPTLTITGGRNGVTTVPEPGAIGLVALALALAATARAVRRKSVQ